MIVTRTPYRISLFGGGTDFPAWYDLRGGAVLSLTINKFCYISLRPLPSYLDYRYKISYSVVETPQVLDGIKHPAVREALRRYSPESSIELNHGGDLPARSGVGSSSAFAVGLIHALKILIGKRNITPFELAQEAIFLEQNILGENVGSQDQIACAYGGINFLRFGGAQSPWSIESLSLNPETIRELETRMVLLYTGISRSSSDVSAGLIRNLPIRQNELIRTTELAEISRTILTKGYDLSQIGEMLNESWDLKMALNPYAVTPELISLCEKAKKEGAIGCKVLGAGGGGFLLLWLANDSRKHFLEKFHYGKVIPFQIENQGSICLAS